MKKYFFFYILLLFSIFATSQKYGQKAIDSLISFQPNIKSDSLKVQNFNEISFKYMSINPELGLIYGKKGLQIAKKIKWDNGIAQSLRVIGQNHLSLGDLKKADYYYEKSKPFIKSKVTLAKLFSVKSGLESMKSNYSSALKYSFQALKIYEEIDDKRGIAISNYSISLLYNDVRDNNKALIYNQKSFEINAKLGIKDELCDNYIMFGEIYRDKNKDKLDI